MTRGMTTPPPSDAPTDLGVTPTQQPWLPDPLLEAFESLRLPLAADPLPEEPDDPLVATLVRRADPALRETGRAMLHLHGWNDYFFHPHVAAFYEDQGFAFYALDLRRYGRSLVEGQLRGYVADLAEYDEELDAAVERIRRDHETLVIGGHSTGGLVAALHAAHRPGVFAGVVLNSPWLDMWGPPALTTVLKALLSQWSRRSPTSVLPLPENEEQIYARAMHVSHGGEWDYDLDLKTAVSEPIRVGWLRAILKGHERVAAGLDIDCPVLVTTSARTSFLRRYSDAARQADTVLDVDRINAVAWRLGPLVTLARIEGGTHDLSLSPPAARARWFSAIAVWLDAYVRPPRERHTLPLEE